MLKIIELPNMPSFKKNNSNDKIIIFDIDSGNGGKKPQYKK